MGRRTLLLVSALLIAALGSTMVYLYAQSADARAREGLELRSVYVATQDIEAGTTVEQATEDLSFERDEISADAVVDGALSSTQPISGQVALVKIYAGEQILEQKFGPVEEVSGPVPLTEGNLAISVSVNDPQRVADFVTPSSSVAIFVTTSRDGEESTSLLLERVKVVAVGDSTTPPTASGEQSASGQSALLTLDVSQADAQKLIFAQEQGPLYLGLVNSESAVTVGEPATTSENLFD